MGTTILIGTTILLGTIAGVLLGFGAGRSKIEFACVMVGGIIWCFIGFLIRANP